MRNLTYSLITLFLLVTSSFAQEGGAVYQSGPAMKRAKIYPVSTVLSNGRVISFGGRGYNFVSCAYADLYDPVANSFTEAPMNFPHDAAAVVKLTDGRYFILGGSMDLGVAPGYSSTEMYDPVTNAFETKASMTMARMQLGAAQLKSGKVLVAGGWYNPSGASSGEIYDTAANTFNPTGALTTPRAFPIVLPTNDGGAVIAGGWPTYGGSLYTSVEYYRPGTNDFVSQSSQLIAGDSGWMLNPIYTRPISDSKMSNGMYLLLAFRSNPSTEYALLTFNPETRLFSKFHTLVPLKDSLTDGGFFDLILNKTGERVHLMGVDSAADPQRLSLVTVSLLTGLVYHPSSSFVLPSQEYFYAAMTFLPSNGKILVQGINASNSSYFTGTSKTYLLTPQYSLGIHPSLTSPALEVSCSPQPASDELNIAITCLEPTLLRLSLIDVQGREVISSRVKVSQPGVQNVQYYTGNLPKGIYKLRVSNEGNSLTKTIILQ